MLEAGYFGVKEWFIEKTEETSKKYNTWINIYSRDENGKVKAEEGFYTVCFAEILQESEKAVYVNLMTGEQVGSCKGWKTWIPKSCIKLN